MDIKTKLSFAFVGLFVVALLVGFVVMCFTHPVAALALGFVVGAIVIGILLGNALWKITEYYRGKS